MIDTLLRKHAHRLIIATGKKSSCSASEESQRRRLHPVAARASRAGDLSSNGSVRVEASCVARTRTGNSHVWQEVVPLL